MNFNKECPHKFSVEETEDGYAIHVQGDKEKLKARLEVFEAYQNFREKAKKAGFTHRDNHNCNGFFSLIHKHMQAIHKQNHSCSERESAE